MDETLITQVEENVDDLPEEVSDFITGDEIILVKEELVRHISKQEEEDLINNNIIFFLLGGISMGELRSSIATLSISEEEKLVVAQIIQERVINELLLTMDVHKELEGSENKDAIKSSSNILTRLNETLTTPATLAPTKREYGTEKTGLPISPSEPSTKPLIDPYREMPEK